MSLDFYLMHTPPEPEEREVFNGNITHNLGKMAREAGIYDCLWRPVENGFEKASDITPILAKGLADLEARPGHYKQFNAANGYGTYEYFLPFVRECLAACREYPNAVPEACR